jgi:putative acetyltransferase
MREATNADGGAIWELIRSTLAEYGIVASRASSDKDLADIDNTYTSAGGAFLVLLDGTTIIGTVALHRESGSTCELCRMYLAAPYRHQGLGRLLFNRALQEAKARGFSEMRLETAAVLVEAISLYKSVGFEVVAGTPSGKNCNVIMSKPLT